MHQVGDQPRLYYAARSTNHQEKNKKLNYGMSKSVYSLNILKILFASSMYITVHNHTPCNSCELLTFCSLDTLLFIPRILTKNYMSFNCGLICKRYHSSCVLIA